MPAGRSVRVCIAGQLFVSVCGSFQTRIYYCMYIIYFLLCMLCTGPVWLTKLFVQV